MEYEKDIDHALRYADTFCLYVLHQGTNTDFAHFLCNKAFILLFIAEKKRVKN